jgi:hypothetical protein
MKKIDRRLQELSTPSKACEDLGCRSSSGVRLTDHLIGLELDGDAVCRDNFPVPRLSAKLDQVRQDVYNGRGFAVIRGIDPLQHSVEDLTIIYLGIQSYVANLQGRQDKKGNMLGKSPC